MIRIALSLICFLAASSLADPTSRLTVIGPAVPAIENARPGCDADDIPDAPARAVRLASGGVLLFVTHHQDRLEFGPDLLHVRHRCRVVMRGSNDDDPAAYDDRAWIASPWTRDGVTIFAVVHNEFQGHRRPSLCPTGRYMDCWFNALTAAVSEDGGATFHRVSGRALVAALPYRYDQVGRGHHGYFNPSNIVTFVGAQYMFAFATQTNAQREGNCLLRTANIQIPESWRAWNDKAFAVAFVNPYLDRFDSEAHVCAPVAPNALRWPVTSLVRHEADGRFIALMQNGARDGGVYFAISEDLIAWSDPVKLLPTVGLGTWKCGDKPPIAYPSLLDPASTDRDFETVGARPVLFATRFNVSGCRPGMDRELIRWNVNISAP